MKAREVVIDLMKKQEITNATLAHRMNVSLATCWDMTANTKRTMEMRTSVMIPALKALDYKLVAIPRDEKVPKGGYVIE